jgi:hypothetical protein
MVPMATTETSVMTQVDELLRSFQEQELALSRDDRREAVTGTYDVSFFLGNDEPQPVSPLQRLASARTGLATFIEETTRALETRNDELTPDQRIHVATIAGYIESLASKFDRIRVPNFAEKRRSNCL